MKQLLQKEWSYLILILLPSLYLAYIWGSLPEKVPLHWNIEGQVDGYGTKTELALLSLILPIGTYLIMLAIPYLDPKDNIKHMGRKFNQIKTLLVAFMSALSLFIIYSSYSKSFGRIEFLLVLIGIFYIIMGNYFKTIRPNYFMGIRTPWTLENEQVWKNTHILAGRLWLGGGIVVVLGSLLAEGNLTFYFFVAITLLITIIPAIYSYIIFKRIQK
jgi:uncharacterized membrane protein